MSEKIEIFQKLDRPRVCLTAYTYAVGKLIAPHVDLILVGDSMGMVLYGMDSTQPMTLEMMIKHGAAVRKGAPDALVIVDMPYGSYEESPEQALTNAQRIMEETGCDGVKLEGGEAMAPMIQHITEHNIPVMAHIGLLPQSAPDEGGFKVKGKTPEQTQQLLRDAKAIEEAGAFAYVLEGTVEEAAQNITDTTTIPSIGIGASAACDGQILVTEDMLGLSLGHVPKFVKHYASLADNISKAAADYADDVKHGKFPGEDHVYH